MIVTYKNDPFLTDDNFGAQITGGTYRSDGTSGEQSEDDPNDGKGGNFDPEAWGSFFGSILTGAGDFASAFTQNQQNQDLLEGNLGSYNPSPTPPPKKDNTTLYVVIGVFALLILIIGFLLTRKKG